MAESSHPPADHSAHYLFLIVGAPLAAFLIAASRAFETHGLTIPLVRITTAASHSVHDAGGVDVGGRHHIRQRIADPPPYSTLDIRRPRNRPAHRIMPASMRLHGSAHLRKHRTQTHAIALRGHVSDRRTGHESHSDMVHLVCVSRQTMDGALANGTGHDNSRDGRRIVRAMAAERLRHRHGLRESHGLRGLCDKESHRMHAACR